MRTRYMLPSVLTSDHTPHSTFSKVGFPGHYAAAHGRDSSRYMHASPRSNGHLSNPHDNSFNVPFPGGGLCTGRNELFLPNRNAPSNAADYTSGNMSSSSGSSSNMCSVLAFSGSKRHTTTAAATRMHLYYCWAAPDVRGR